jgi:hypothetical protein
LPKNTHSGSREKEEKEHVVVRAGRAVYYVVSAFFESMTVSFYNNVKKRYAKQGNEYVELKVPRGYKDNKLDPEYKDLSSTGEFSDFSGLPGFK